VGLLGRMVCGAAGADGVWGCWGGWCVGLLGRMVCGAARLLGCWAAPQPRRMVCGAAVACCARGSCASCAAGWSAACVVQKAQVRAAAAGARALGRMVCGAAVVRCRSVVRGIGCAGCRGRTASAPLCWRAAWMPLMQANHHTPHQHTPTLHQHHASVTTPRAGDQACQAEGRRSHAGHRRRRQRRVHDPGGAGWWWCCWRWRCCCCWWCGVVWCGGVAGVVGPRPWSRLLAGAVGGAAGVWLV
jgi:hypothetical protein